MDNLIRDQRKTIVPFWLSNWMYFLKVKFGATITDARGSLAGNTYSRNHYGAYIRARTTPTNPNTDLQQQCRNSIAFLADAWASTLTAAQRTAWDLYGSSVAMTDTLGATMYLTGYNHFLRSNSVRKRSGLTVIAPGPVIFEIPAQDPVFTCSGSEATQQISVAFDNTMAWANENGGFMLVFQGQPQNAQRSFFDGPWVIMGAIVGDAVAAPASPQLMNVPIAIAEGQRQWVYARIVRADGRLSQRFRHDHFCGA